MKSRLGLEAMMSRLGLEAMMSRFGLEAMMSRLGLGRFGPRSSSDRHNIVIALKEKRKSAIIQLLVRVEPQ